LIYCLRIGFFWAGFFLCILTRLQPVAADLLQASPKIKPDFFVSMDGGEASEYAIVVEKETQKLVLYRYNGVYEPVFNVKCSTGEVPGIKTRSGDKKTPEGIYFFTGLFEKKYLSAVYGEMAFPMDYPNLIDQLNGREGNSIWMHGTNKQIKDRASNGCIVLANADIEKLSKYITVNRTPIIVTDKIHYTELDDDQTIKEQLKAFLLEWNGALLNGSYERYLSFYDQGTISRIAWWDEWNDMRNELRQSGFPADIHLNKLSIYKHNGVFTALFNQLIQVGKQVQDVGIRKVCLKTEADTIRIIGDIYQSFMPKNNEQKAENPFLRACHDLKKSYSTNQYYSANKDIEALVDKWLAAWKNKDIETYGDCYASDFRFKQMDRKAWLEKKKRLSQRYKYISVSKEKIVVKTGVKTSTATFIQKYKSSGYRAVGEKELIFKRENGQWKIYRERWKKI
jgi:murein L,D-transpeptidase YafK